MHKSKRLLPPVILHATANALALVMELTPLSGMLANCMAWLTNNVAAALFITIGLAAASVGALFVLIKYGFDRNKRDNKPAPSSAASEKDGDADDNRDEMSAPDRMRDQISAAARKKDGTFRFWTGIVICALLLLINLAVTVL